MAANLALGSQCAVGTSLVYQHRQIGSNLVTKSHHVTANPTLKPKAPFPLSGNRIDHSNSVTKSRQYQVKMTATPTKGPAVYTKVNLFNSTDQYLTLNDRHDWTGIGNPPLVIRANTSQAFEHNADPQAGVSVGGVVYAIEHSYKWIVAWSNMNNQPNKFYTDIINFSDPIDWDKIRAKLSTGQAGDSTITAYKSTVTIDETSATPNVAATLQRV